MFIVNQITIIEGSVEPAASPGTLRLYSMRFCPYGQRAVIYAAKKRLPYVFLLIYLLRYLNNDEDTIVLVHLPL